MIHDYPEGQTHSYNDGCGIKEHNMTLREKMNEHHSPTCAYYQFMFYYETSLSEEEAPECDCKEEEK